MARLSVSPKEKQTGRFAKTHGMAHTPEYAAWANAIYRCENQAAGNWFDYGGRGIRVCDAWRHSFDAFLRDMGRRPTPRHSLDRIDVDGDYCPENCRWADAALQANNRRNTPRIAGLTPKELALKTGLPYNTIKNRMRRGWTEERIINQPRRDYPERGNVDH